MKQASERPHEPRPTSPFSLRIPAPLLRLLRQRALESERSVGAEIVHMLDEHLWWEEKTRRSRRGLVRNAIVGRLADQESPLDPQVAELEEQLRSAHEASVEAVRAVAREKFNAADFALEDLQGKLRVQIQELREQNAAVQKRLGQQVEKLGRQKQRLFRLLGEQERTLERMERTIESEEGMIASGTSETPIPPTE